MTDDTDRPDDYDSGSPKPGEYNKPVILVAPGDNHLATEAAEKALAAKGNYFTSGNALVRIVNRDGRGLSVERVNEQTIKLVLSEAINWSRKGQYGEWLRCDPPHDVVKALLHGQDRHHLKPLNGLARQPYFGSDGRLVDRPGYDPETGTYGVFDASDYHLDTPTRELADHSLSYLYNLLSEFVFEQEVDRSAALAAIFTAVTRPSLSVAPAFNFTAANSGSGKSCLAETTSLFAGGDEPYRVSYPSSAEEAGKLVVTVLMEKPAVVLFDDMQTNWKPYGPINRMLTSPTTTERLLGTNRSASVSTKALFLGTGNHTEPERDLRRRVVSVHLAPRHETPALRSFQGDPIAELKRHRPMAVKCVLNIIRAYRAAGEPMEKVPPISTFEEWARMCRHPLIWMGCPDPAQSLIDQVSNDPDRQALGELMDVWFRHFKTKSITVRELVSKAHEVTELMEALEQLPVMDGRHLNPGKLGWFVSKNRGRRVDQLRIEAGDSSERRSWKIVAE